MAARKALRAEQIAGQILEIARHRGLRPGDRLVEQRLAESLGVSRGPVRSGLQSLAASGVVIGAPNRGYVLAQKTSSKSVKAALAAASEGERRYRAIADDRLDARLPDVVSEAELMRRYDLGRPDLLRLLDRIATEGWVERMPGYGWRFADTLSGRAAYSQSARFRAAIEPAALLEPGFHLEAGVIAQLRSQQQRLLDGELETMMMGEVFQLGCAFHEEIARGTGNPFYVEALKRVNSIRRLFAYRMLADRNGILRHIREHLRMLDLLANGRNHDAAELMRKHLRRLPRPISMQDRA